LELSKCQRNIHGTLFKLDIDVNNEKNMGVIEVNLEIFEFFGTQTIENVNPFPCSGGGKC
jgi:hypothetical protein